MISKTVNVKVTSNQIKTHWNGSVVSCPIHEAIEVALKFASIVEVYTDYVTINGKFIDLPRKAAQFSKTQANLRESLVGNTVDTKKVQEVQKIALSKLKPFSFKLRVPEVDNATDN